MVWEKSNLIERVFIEESFILVIRLHSPRLQLSIEFIVDLLTAFAQLFKLPREPSFSCLQDIRLMGFLCHKIGVYTVRRSYCLLQVSDLRHSWCLAVEEEVVLCSSSSLWQGSWGSWEA